MKPTQIAAEKYLQDQLDKHTVTDALDDILKKIENQTYINKTHTNNDLLNNICTGNSRSSTQQEYISNNNLNNFNQINGIMNNEETDSVNKIPLHKEI